MGREGRTRFVSLRPRRAPRVTTRQGDVSDLCLDGSSKHRGNCSVDDARRTALHHLQKQTRDKRLKHAAGASVTTKRMNTYIHSWSCEKSAVSRQHQRATWASTAWMLRSLLYCDAMAMDGSRCSV